MGVISAVVSVQRLMSFPSNRTDLQQYLKPVFLSILTRLHANATDKFVYLFAKFIMYLMAANVDGITPDFLIQPFEQIQPQYVSFPACNYE